MTHLRLSRLWYRVSSSIVGIHDCVRRRIDGRHPNPRLVHFEEIGDQIVEIDVFLGVIEEGELAVVTANCEYGIFLRRPRQTHCWNSASRISIRRPCSETLF